MSEPEDITPETFPNVNQIKRSIVADLPDSVKDPKNFEKIQRALLETIRKCKKSHSDPHEMSLCKTCTEGMLERHALMGKFGFNSMKQYREWLKIMDIMINNKRVPLE